MRRAYLDTQSYYWFSYWLHHLWLDIWLHHLWLHIWLHHSWLHIWLNHLWLHLWLCFLWFHIRIIHLWLHIWLHHLWLQFKLNYLLLHIWLHHLWLHISQSIIADCIFDFIVPVCSGINFNSICCLGRYLFQFQPKQDVKLWKCTQILQLVCQLIAALQGARTCNS